MLEKKKAKILSAKKYKQYKQASYYFIANFVILINFVAFTNKNMLILFFRIFHICTIITLQMLCISFFFPQSITLSNMPLLHAFIA